MDTAAAIEKDDDVNAIRAEVVEILAAAVVRLLIEGRCLSKQAGRVPLVALSAPECTSSQASREALVQESATPAREDEGTPRDEALDGELDHGARIAELHPWLQLQPLIPLRVEVLAEGKEAHVDALEVVAGDLAEHRTRWERDGAADVRETPVGRDEDHSAVLATQDPQHADVHSVLQIVLAQLLGHSSPFPDRASVEFLAPLKRPSDDRDPVQDALVKACSAWATKADAVELRRRLLDLLCKLERVCLRCNGPMLLTMRSRNAIILAVARPKEFDREVALRHAIQVFWKKGFARTSAEDLVAAMGIGKQSLYDTFGDKRRLFLEALRTYNSEGVAVLVKRVAGGASRIAAIEGVLVELANEQPYKRALGCMGVNSICELGDDEDVRAVSTMAAVFQETALTSLIEDAKQQGEVSDAVDARAAARFLATILSGMRVQAKAGASVEALRDVAAFAVRGLRRKT